MWPHLSSPFVVRAQRQHGSQVPFPYYDAARQAGGFLIVSGSVPCDNLLSVSARWPMHPIMRSLESDGEARW